MVSDFYLNAWILIDAGCGLRSSQALGVQQCRGKNLAPYIDLLCFSTYTFQIYCRALVPHRRWFWLFL